MATGFGQRQSRQRIGQAMAARDFAEYQQVGEAAIFEHEEHRARGIQCLAQIFVREYLDPDPDEQ